MDARADKRLVLVGAASIAVIGYGWWFTDREPFSPAALRAFLVAAGLLIAMAEVRRARRRSGAPAAATRRPPRFRAAVVVWSAVFTALVAWELMALPSSPRSEHPTISSMVEGLEHHHLARLALFVGWIWSGWRLAS